MLSLLKELIVILLFGTGSVGLVPLVVGFAEEVRRRGLVVSYCVVTAGVPFRAPFGPVSGWSVEGGLRVSVV